MRGGHRWQQVQSRQQSRPQLLAPRKEQIEQSIQRYLDALETADRVQTADFAARTDCLQQKIGKLREQMRQLDETKQ